MRYLSQFIIICGILLIFSGCSSTRQITINTIEPSPVDFSNQVKKIGIVNTSTSKLTKNYTTRLEQLIVLEERWLAEKGTDAALTGLFDELLREKRFETVKILAQLPDEMPNFGTNPDQETWELIAQICKENDIDAIFALASHETATSYSLKKAKMEQYDMLRERIKVSAQEITLETLIENGWRIYDPKLRKLIDEFTSNEQIVASARGGSPVEALQAIDRRREQLLEQSKQSGSSYAQRMQPQQFAIERDYYAFGTENFKVASKNIQNGEYSEAEALWEEEIANPKARISSRACYNLAVLKEFNHDLEGALHWANKSYQINKDDTTLDYIMTLEGRQAQTDVLKAQLAETAFDD